MIPQQTPVKNHYGNNTATIFDFDFYIEDESQLQVTHTDLDGNETILELGVDYKINSNSIGYSEGGNITFPIDGSSYGVLAWDTSTDKKELLSIALDIPIEQPAEYGLSDHLNLNNLEYSFDYLTRICQIIMHTLERTMKVSEGSGEMNLKLPLPESNQTFKWNEDATALENYDIIGENNAFKTQLISDIEVEENKMTTTIANNKAELESEMQNYKDVTDANIDNFKAAVDTTIANNKAEMEEEIATFTDNTTLEMADFETKINQDIVDAKSDLQTQMDNYKIDINTDIEDFELHVESTISTVEEAAKKINELEEAVEEAKSAASSATSSATSATTAANNATTAAANATDAANAASKSAQEVKEALTTRADLSLSNLDETGQAKLDAKLETSVYNQYVSTTAETLSGLETNKATKTELNDLKDITSDMQTEIDYLWNDNDRLYQGVDLSVKFADEIAGYSTIYDWLNARKNASNFEGIHVGDYMNVSTSAGTCAGYSIPAQTHKCRIIGINTYKGCADNEIGDMIYFSSDNVVDTTIKWNPTDNNNGTSVHNEPYLASAAYAVLNGINNYTTSAYNSAAHGANASSCGILQLLPSALQNVLKQKRNLLDTRYSSSGLLTNSTGWGWQDMGKLWLPNEIEVYGTQIRSNTSQTSGWWNPEANLSIQFAWFANNAEHRIKRNSSGGRCFWWLSSAASNYSTNVCYVYNGGYASDYTATDAYICVPLCFCI